MGSASNRDRTVLGIGAFARLSGISIPRLRRYHEAGLLVPADVDRSTGHRTYRRAQLAQARELSRLRRTDLPLQELGAAMSADPNVRLKVLVAHRRRLEERLAADQRMIEMVDQLIREERVSSTTESLQPMEVIIRVADVEKTIGFYRDVLGFDFQPSDHESAPLHYNATGGAWDPEGFFLFTVFPETGWTTRAEFGFQVDNVDEVWARAKTHPGAQLREPEDSDHVPRNATITDPDGNRINLYQRFTESLATFQPHSD
ncbi:MAG: MerR family transcriptional regulator [Acidimicrobiales bacterium]